MHGRRVCILTHKRQRFADAKLGDSHYVLADVARVWERRGHTVEVVRGVPGGGRGDGPGHDVGVLHIDLTKVPAAYARFAATHPVVVNGRTPDISKRVVSGGLLTRADLPAHGGVPVIVKTDRNYGGFGEGGVQRRSSRTRRVLHRWCRRLPWWMRSEMDTLEYRVYDRADLVPRGVWWNPGLVVERFHTERRDGLYWLRTWVFLGDRGLLRFFGSDKPVVKGANIRVRTFEDPEDPAMLPDSVRARRAELGLDFGKIDYLCAEDGVHVIDANRTVTTRLEGEQAVWQAELLADGLESLRAAGR